MWTLLLGTALAFDQGPWQAVLDTYVDDQGLVNYAGIASSHALEGYVAALADVDEPLPRADKMAFWLNAYNALTVELMAENPSVASIRDLDGGKVWDTRSFVVAHRPVTLNDIENQMLRIMGDPRVHSALNCASKGCPPLYRHAFDPAKLDDQLQETSRRWLETDGIKVDTAARTVKLSRIFDWYGADFQGMHIMNDIPNLSGKQEAAIDFAIRYLPADVGAFLKKGAYTVSYLDYDWSANRR